MIYVQYLHFTEQAATLAQDAVDDRGEAAVPAGGGFAKHAMISLHCLRVHLEKSYREALDLVSETPQTLGEIGLEAADLSDHSTLAKAFGKMEMAIWQVLSRLTSQLHEPSGHAATDSTFFDRANASRHYCRQTIMALPVLFEI
jgi:IS5 family transposase